MGERLDLGGGSIGADIFGRMRSARVVSLIEVGVCEGDGTRENMTRVVTYWYTPAGELMAKRDPRDDLEIETDGSEGGGT